MDLKDAVYNTAHDHGGTEALAKRMGISGGVFRAKVNPHDDSRWLSLVEADKLMGLTGDFRMLHALAAGHEHIVLPMAESSMDGMDTGLYGLVMGFIRGRTTERDINRMLAGIEGLDETVMRRKVCQLQKQLTDLLMHLDGQEAA